MVEIRTVTAKFNVPDKLCVDLHHINVHLISCVNITSECTWRLPQDYCETLRQKVETGLNGRFGTKTALGAYHAQKWIQRAIGPVKSCAVRIKEGKKKIQTKYDRSGKLFSLFIRMRQVAGETYSSKVTDSGTKIRTTHVVDLNSDYTASASRTVKEVCTDRPTTTVVGN